MDENYRGNPRFNNQIKEYSPLHYERQALFFLLIIFLMAVPFFCVAKTPNRKSEYSQRIIDFCVSRINGRDLRWELKADDAMVQDNMERALLREISLHYYLMPDRDMVLKGDQAEVHFPGNLVTVKGGIKAESKLGLSLETETLVWNGDKRLISTQDWVVIRRPNLEMSGKGLEADLDLENIKIKANVKTIIY